MNRRTDPHWGGSWDDDGWADRAEEHWQYDDVPEEPAAPAAPAAVAAGSPPSPGGVTVREERFPRTPSRWRGVLTFLAVIGLLVSSGWFGLRWVRQRIDPPGPPGEARQVTIPKGTSTAKIAEILQREGIVTDARFFRWWAQLKGKGGFDAGKYSLNTRSSFDEALAALAKGPAAPTTARLTVPEGFRLTQIAERVATLPGRSAARFLEEVGRGQIRSQYQPSAVNVLEGMLFPETYTFEESETERDIAVRMVGTFDQVALEVSLDKAKEKVGLSPYEALVVASLIEREAKTAEDRGKISRVIYNRLAKGIKLQVDATIIYALGGNRTRVLFEDLELDSPYNTYKVKGLPPTPIASPGKAALEAALNPTPGNWLYYVVTGSDGSHGFATTLREHRRNIALAEQRGLR